MKFSMKDYTTPGSLYAEDGSEVLTATDATRYLNTTMTVIQDFTRRKELTPALSYQSMVFFRKRDLEVIKSNHALPAAKINA